MFQHLVEQIALGTQLRPDLEALRRAWERLPLSRRRRFRSLDRYAYAEWSQPRRNAFRWHGLRETLQPIAYPYTAHIVFKSGSDPVPRTWELLGFGPAIRHRLALNLRTLDNIPEAERPPDLKVMHREIVTACRIEDMALHRQVKHLTEFLETGGCRILHIRGVDDADAELRRQPFKPYTSESYRARLDHLLERFFALTPLVLRHPAGDPRIALRETGADRLIAFDPDRHPRFELEPVLKAECVLYLTAGVLEFDVTDLRLTIEGVIDVLEERFHRPVKTLAHASA